MSDENGWWGSLNNGLRKRVKPMTATKHMESIKFEKPGKYRIEVDGSLDEHWSDRWAGMRITTVASEGDTPVTSLVGNLRDQAQLSGVLNSLYELHLPIRLVEHLPADNGSEASPD
jgi:hypothetical protein